MLLKLLIFSTKKAGKKASKDEEEKARKLGGETAEEVVAIQVGGKTTVLI